MSLNHAPFHINNGLGRHKNNRNTNHISDWLKYWACPFYVLCVVVVFYLGLFEIFMSLFMGTVFFKVSSID